MKSRLIGLVAGVALLAQSTMLLTLPSRFQMTTVVEAKDSAGETTRNRVTHQPSVDVKQAFGKLPLSFEPNQGQADRRVKFLSRGKDYALLLTQNEAMLSLRSGETDSTSKEQGSENRPAQAAVLRMKLIGAKSGPVMTGSEPQSGKTNYLLGNDPKKWHTDVQTFAKVRYAEVYPGIDMVYYGNQRTLEYDFVVAPGADPQAIRLAFEGADEVKLGDDGTLRLVMKGTEITQPAPVIYQKSANNQRTIVTGSYLLNARNEVSFQLGDYDHSRELVIDPQLLFATFYGGSGLDTGESVATDATGNIYITGITDSANLEVRGAFQGTPPGGKDAYVVKLNPSGTDIIYATYLGSTNHDEGGNAIAVTSDGKACVTGVAGNFNIINSNFPTTPGRFQGSRVTPQGNDVFLTVLTAAGNGLFYSTFFGASFSEQGNGIAVDATNKIYLTGFTNADDFPTKNAFQNARGSSLARSDAFIAKFDPAQSGNNSLVYSSYLGGGGNEIGNDVAVTADGVAFVVGITGSFDFPTKSSSALPAFQTTQGGVNDGFIAKVSPAGGLIYSTYFGGNDQDRINGVAVDSFERAYITGQTFSNAGTFPLKNAFQPNPVGSDTDGFVAKFNADGTALFYSSFLGAGTINSQGNTIAIDGGGNAYVGGSSTFFNQALTVNGFPASVQNGPGFVAKVEASDATGSSIPKVLYLDGFGSNVEDAALDPRGNLLLVGSNGLPILITTTPGAFQESFNGGSSDVTVAKVASTFPDSIGVFRPSTGEFLFRNSNTSGRAELITTFGQAGDQALAGDWNGDGKDDPGVFRPSTSQFLLRQPTLFFGVVINATLAINFGQNGDKAVVGDWDGDGIDTPGVFRNGQWLLTNSPNVQNSSPTADLSFNFGAAADTPVAGDWNGDGIDTIGTFNLGVWSLRNSNSAGGANITALSGSAPGNKPIAGDWNGDGVDSIGVFVPANVFGFTAFALNNLNATSNGFDIIADFGVDGDLPVAGDWDGKPGNTPPNSGINNPAEGVINAGQTQVFTTTCSDPDGWHDIQKIDFKIAQNRKAGSAGDDSLDESARGRDDRRDAEDGNGGGDGAPLILWVQFDENRNVIRFYDPDLQTWSEAAGGSNIVLESRFARLFLSGTAVQGSGPLGPSVQITWKVAFKEAAKGSHRQFLRITDDASASTGFDRVGSWKVKK